MTAPDDMEGFGICIDAHGCVRRLLRVKPGLPTVAIVGSTLYVRGDLIDSLHGEPVWIYRESSAERPMDYYPMPIQTSGPARGEDEAARELTWADKQWLGIHNECSPPPNSTP